MVITAGHTYDTASASRAGASSTQPTAGRAGRSAPVVVGGADPGVGVGGDQPPGPDLGPRRGRRCRRPGGRHACRLPLHRSACRLPLALAGWRPGVGRWPSSAQRRSLHPRCQASSSPRTAPPATGGNRRRCYRQQGMSGCPVQCGAVSVGAAVYRSEVDRDRYAGLNLQSKRLPRPSGQAAL
jgi:hypothetical protein